MGFGGGAIIAAPLNEFLIKTFYEAPDCLGMSATVPLITEHGRPFAEVGGALAEIVVVGTAGIANRIVPGVEGVYLAGTERTGAAPTFFALGVTYFCVMLAAAFAFRVPVEDWKPAGWSEDAAAAAHDDDGASRRRLVSAENVHLNQTHKKPQFYLLWVMLCFNVTAGIAVIGVTKTMMTDIFASSVVIIYGIPMTGTSRGYSLPLPVLGLT